MIHINNLTFGYGYQPLFKNLDATFESGKIYGLLGKNGAGKTTLFKLICGLLRSNQGSTDVLGYSSQKRSVQMLQDLFFIPESFYLPPVTIRNFHNLHAPLYKYFNSELFYQTIEELSLNPDQKLNTLSYGLIKRFLLAFGLATDCRILLLDEPTNGLDIPSKRIFRKLLASSISKDRMFIIATHQIKEIENIFDHLMFIDNGRILLSRDIGEISQKLTFRNTTELAPPQNALFSEEIAGGYAVLEKNEVGEESRIDIEFLFNAVMESPDAIVTALNEKQEEEKNGDC